MRPPAVTSAEPAPEPTVDEKLEKGLRRTIEFVGRFLGTAADFLFRPSRFDALAQQAGAVPQSRGGSHVAPLTYLLSSAVVCTVYGYASATSPTGAKLLLHSPLFAPFVAVLTFAWDKIAHLKLGELVLVMVPLVLFAVLFSLALATACRLFRMKHEPRVLLSLSAYWFGTYLLLHGMLFSYALLSGVVYQAAHDRVFALLLLAVHAPICMLIVIGIVHYVRLLKVHLAVGMARTLGVIATGTLLFALVFAPLGLIAFPLVVKL
jgi:hypothetical protein